jgi:hypothetical protein
MSLSTLSSCLGLTVEYYENKIKILNRFLVSMCIGKESYVAYLQYFAPAAIVYTQAHADLALEYILLQRAICFKILISIRLFKSPRPTLLPVSSNFVLL